MAPPDISPVAESRLSIEYWKRRLLNNFARAARRGWLIPGVEFISSVVLVLIGVAFALPGWSLVAVIALLTYIVFFGVVKLVLSETFEDIRAAARKEASNEVAKLVAELRDRLQKTEASMELYFAAQDFLTWRIAKTGEVITSLIGLDKKQLTTAADQSIKKVTTINEVLRDLCKSLTAIAAKSLNRQLPDSYFRGTYLEVRKIRGREKLEFVGWHTRDGNQPRSMSEHKTMIKGQGVAGRAWKRKRPVIEDFKNLKEFKELYTSQSKNYKSMASVPVMRGSRDYASEVIGVITVDTDIPGYFGRKDDRVAEDKAGSIVWPYASYIAFLTAIDEAVKLVREHITSE